MTTGVPVDVRRRLDAVDLARLAELGFAPADRPPAVRAAAFVRERPDALAAVEAMAERLVAGIGEFDSDAADAVFPEPPAGPDVFGPGVLPMLALVATAPEVAAYHADRGIPAAVSAATLADLGQQVWVHRLTYASFGLHAYGWLTRAWSGDLYWLGRLQFNLQRDRGDWVLSTHIPRTSPQTGGGGLDPDQVDAAFAHATRFFATHFPEYPTRDFCCRSWLLDPELAGALPDSRLAGFQRRWRLTGEDEPGDEDALFFVFSRRGPVDLGSLPTDTALRRVVVDRLRSGGHWRTVGGRLAQQSAVQTLD